MRNIIVFLFFLLFYLATAKAASKDTCIKNLLLTLKKVSVEKLGRPEFGMRFNSPMYYYQVGNKQIAYMIIDILDLDAVNIFLSQTDYGFRGLGINKKLMKQLAKDIGELNFVQADLHENNEFVFVKNLIYLIDPTLEIPMIDYQIKEDSFFINNYFHTIAFDRYTALSDEQREHLHEIAIKQTPFYKSSKSIGLGNIHRQRVRFHSDTMSFSINVILSK